MKFVCGLLMTLILPVSGVGETLNAQSERSLSIEELPKLIKERNENLKAARIHVEAQEMRTGHLARSFLPKVSGSYGSEEFKYGDVPNQRATYWRLGASVNVYHGGKDLIDEKIQKKQVEGAKSDLVLSYYSELKSAQGAYWDLVALQKMLALRQEELKRNEDHIRSSKKRVGAGVATSADAVQFEMNQANILQSIRRLELKRDVVRNQLAIALGLDEHENIVAKDDFPNPTSINFPLLKMEDSSVFRAAEAKVSTNRLRSKKFSRWWQPKLDLYATHGLPSLEDEYERSLRKEKETAFGVVLSLDLGNGLNDVNESRAQSLDAKSEEHRLNTLTKQIVASDHELRHDIQLTMGLVADSQKNSERARQFLNLTKNEYARGLKNGPDLLAASRQYYELQDQTLELNRDLQMAKIELEGLLASAKGLE